MSLSSDRFATTDRADIMADGRAYLVAWGSENGLEVWIKPAVPGSPQETAFLGYGAGVASWFINRDGVLL